MAELDPSIALHGLLINRNDENLKQQQLQMGQMRMRQAQQEQANQRRLGDLLPQALNGDKTALGQIAAVNPQLYMQLETHQQEAVKAQFAEMTDAVRWAMQDPSQKAQRWNQVIDHYSAQFPQVSQYRDHPEMAEPALMQLGQMGQYLEGAPKNDATALQRNYEYLKQQNPQLADQYLRNQAEGPPMIASNGDGTFTIIPKGYAQQPQGNVPPPPPGFVIDGGQTPPASGAFSAR